MDKKEKARAASELWRKKKRESGFVLYQRWIKIDNPSDINRLDNFLIAFGFCKGEKNESDNTLPPDI